MAGRFYEHFHRSIIKAITFRMVILVSNGIIIFLIIRRYDLTLAVVLFSNLSSTIIYILHERIWNNVHWGKHRKGRNSPL